MNEPIITAEMFERFTSPPEPASIEERTCMLTLAARLILDAIGEDLDRDGLRDTPARFARMWLEFADYEPGRTDTAFDTISTDQMVAITGIKVWSLCEHHLLPFSCTINIGYITRSKILGLSKFARIAQKHAHKLQVQERLVEEIALEVAKVTGSPNVAVSASGEHLCMLMRGAKQPHTMHSSKLMGVFLEQNGSARAEFGALVNASSSAAR